MQPKFTRYAIEVCVEYDNEDVEHTTVVVSLGDYTEARQLNAEDKVREGLARHWFVGVYGIDAEGLSHAVADCGGIDSATLVHAALTATLAPTPPGLDAIEAVIAAYDEAIDSAIWDPDEALSDKENYDLARGLVERASAQLAALQPDADPVAMVTDVVTTKDVMGHITSKVTIQALFSVENPWTFQAGQKLYASPYAAIEAEAS